MDEHAARQIWLVRAFERADRDGRLIPFPVRARASRQARGEALAGAVRGEELSAELRPEPAAYLTARAKELSGYLGREHALVAPSFRFRAWRAAWPLLALVLAFALGLGLNALGPTQKISILSFPLLGLIAWNVLVYVALAVLALRPVRSGDLPRLGGLEALVAKVGPWLASPNRAWFRLQDVREKARVVEGLREFLRGWTLVGAPLHLARFRVVFHLAAAGLVAGAVAGMYVRGFALEYTATWESTFLDAGQVRAVLGVVFAPACALTGAELPSVEGIEALRGGGGDAALWIHLYAVTAAVFVLVPRAALAFLSRGRARRLARSFPLPVEGDPYFDRLLAADRGEGARARVVPYSFRPSARASENLQSLLLDLLGNRATVTSAEPVPYGEDGEEAAADPAVGPSCRVLLFNLAQTPEQEVHGEFIEDQRARTERLGAPASLLVALDETAYRKRFGGDAAGEERLVERRRAWERLVQECGLVCVLLDLERPLPDKALAASRAAMWPREAVGAPQADPGLEAAS